MSDGGGGEKPRRESHFESAYSSFRFLGRPGSPHWRKPQLGALAAVIAKWVVSPEDPVLVSLPTGSGKSGVAAALPYLARSRRTLVVVPGIELRRQLADEFRDERVLRAIGAVDGSLKPTVVELSGRSTVWTDLETVDVAVGIPSSISPTHFAEGAAPDPDLFDLIIVDEAHHAPAATWRSILEYFSGARAVLLTATPRRADGKQVPGDHAFHYPLRLAISDGIYKPIQPELLDVDPGWTEQDLDRVIADEVVRSAALPEHATSAILIRANSINRATRLKALYREHGLDAEVVNSRVPAPERDRILGEWRTGKTRAVIAVDMLGEGVDIPRLRIVGYHDKHKSVLSTLQFIGRLARTSSEFPQPSVLITVKDADVYPQLQTALRDLYTEDPNWVELLPRLLDDEIEERRLDAEYASTYATPPPSISLIAMSPVARASIFESRLGFVPGFVTGAVAESLQAGAALNGQTIVYSSLNEHSSQLVILTSRPDTPKWYREDSGLTRDVYDLHVLSWHRDPTTANLDLLFVNTKEAGFSNAIREILDPDHILRNGDPMRLQDAFDSLERHSVSSIGVRNTFAGTPGTPSYAMFAGRGVDQGLREADTNSRALGHAIAQVQAADGDFTTAGMSAAKSKYWETRYLPLRQYEEFTNELAHRYWSPRLAQSGPLLPTVARGVRLEHFPASTQLITGDLHPSLLGTDWRTVDGYQLEQLELVSHGDISPDRLPFQLRLVHDPDLIVWEGAQESNGTFTGTSLDIVRGKGQKLPIASALAIYPPTLYLLDGHTVVGSMLYLPVTTQDTIPDLAYRRWDWTGVDISKETGGPYQNGVSIHSRVEEILAAQAARSGHRRWVLLNDGHGEIADHVVIEYAGTGRPIVELWHSKASHNTSPGARVSDMQVVTVQAAKSRRFVTDRQFWVRIGRRLDGLEGPKMELIGGDPVDDLRALCGLIPERQKESIAEFPPQMQATIVLVQPGFDIEVLRRRLHAGEMAAGQVREFLVFLANAIQGTAHVDVVGS